MQLTARQIHSSVANYHISTFHFDFYGESFSNHKL